MVTYVVVLHFAVVGLLGALLAITAHNHELKIALTESRIQNGRLHYQLDYSLMLCEQAVCAMNDILMVERRSPWGQKCQEGGRETQSTETKMSADSHRAWRSGAWVQSDSAVKH